MPAERKGLTEFKYTTLECQPTQPEWYLLTAGTSQFFIRDRYVGNGSHSVLARYLLGRYDREPLWLKHSLHLRSEKIMRSTPVSIARIWKSAPKHDYMLVAENVETYGGHDFVCQLLAEWKNLDSAKQLPLPAFEAKVLALTGDDFYNEEEEEDSDWTQETDETELDKE